MEARDESGRASKKAKCYETVLSEQRGNMLLNQRRKERGKYTRRSVRMGGGDILSNIDRSGGGGQENWENQCKRKIVQYEIK